MQILNMLWRWLRFWLSLFVKISLWAGAALLGMWLWARGPEGFVADVEDLVAYWQGEYRYYKSQAEQATIEARFSSRRGGRGGGTWF